MARAADKLKISLENAVSVAELERLARTATSVNRDFKVVDNAVDFALSTLPGNLGSLSQLCSINARGYEWPIDIVDGWSKHLLGVGSMANDRSSEQAMLVAAASLAAWTSLAPLEAQARSSATPLLANKTKTTLIESAMPGTRAQFLPSGEMSSKGKQLAENLLAGIRRQRYGN
jgi:hypothetical protein